MTARKKCIIMHSISGTEIIVLSLIISIYRSPLIYSKYYYKRTFLSYIWPRLKLNEENIVGILNNLSKDRNVYEKLVPVNENMLLLHVEISINIQTRNKNNLSPVTIDILIDALTLKIINIRHISGLDNSVDRFINICDIIVNNGVIILENKYYNEENIKILMAHEKDFIIEICENSLSRLKKILKIGRLSLKREYNEVLKYDIYYAKYRNGKLFYYFFYDGNSGVGDTIEVNTGVRIAVSNLDIDHNLIYQAINLRNFLHKTLLYSRYRLYNDNIYLNNNMLIDGYLMLNSIALEMYLSLYRCSNFIHPHRSKYINSLLLELSGIDIFLIKNNVYLPGISRNIDKELNYIDKDINIKDLESLMLYKEI